MKRIPYGRGCEMKKEEVDIRNKVKENEGKFKDENLI